MKKALCLLCLCLLLPVWAFAEAPGWPLTQDGQVLDFDASGAETPDARALAELLNTLPGVKEVRLYESSMSREDMEWLFDSFPEVFFGWTLHIGPHVIRTDATAFSTLHRSSMTDRRDSHHTSRELSILRLCPRLKALDLGHNKLTDLSFLSGLTELRLLIISPNYNIEDLTPLAALTELEYLEAFSTKARDVSPLSGLEKLRDLNLACSRKLEDISCLYGLPALERFWCGRGVVPRQQQREMEESHPGCTFNWVTQPTLGGWREHPHYDTLYRMFREGVYIPFDD